MDIHQSEVKPSRIRLILGGVGFVALSISLFATSIVIPRYYQSNKQQLEQTAAQAAFPIGNCSIAPKKEFGVKPELGMKQLARDRLVEENNQIRTQISELQQVAEKDKKNKVSQIIGLASSRKSTLLELMDQDPESALNFVFLASGELQNTAQNCFEQETTLEGTLEVMHVDFFEDGLSYTESTLITNSGKKIKLHPTEDNHPTLESGTKVKVRGIMVDDEIVFDSSRPIPEGQDLRGGLDVISQPGNPPVEGEQKVLVIPVYFLDNSPGSYTVDQIRNYTINELDKYYKEISYNKVSIAGDVLGWTQLPINKTCDSNVIRTRAIAAVDSQVYFPNYSRLIIVGYPCSSNQGTIGKQSLPTQDGNVLMSTAWFMTGAIVNWTTVVHELGHNFGNHHADFINCGAVSLAVSGCTVEEYNDRFDVMGWGTGHFNAPHKEHLGWFGDGNIINIKTNGNYSLEPLETATNGLKTVKIQRGRSDYLYVEFRQPIGYDTFDNRPSLKSAHDGGLLHIIPVGSPYRTQLINAKLGLTGYELLPGNTFTDPATASRVTVLSKNSNSLNLDVNLGKTDFNPPVNWFISPIGGSTVTGMTNVSTDSTDESGIQKVEFYLDGSLLITDSEAPYEFLWNTTQTSNGFHNLTAKAYDKSGEPWGVPGNTTLRGISVSVSNLVSLTPTQALTPTVSPTLTPTQALTPTVSPTLTPTQALTPTVSPTPIQDTVPPTVSITFPVNGGTVARNKTTVISASASDNSGISKVEFYVNNILTCTDSTFAYSCSWKVPAQKNSVYSIQAKAFDNRGNTAISTISVTAK